MANATDPKVPTDLDTVFAALKTERDYQRLRWGKRMPDGSISEVKKFVSDYLLYMIDYHREAITKASRCPGTRPALDVLRKVVALGMACLQYHGFGWDFEHEELPESFQDVERVLREEYFGDHRLLSLSYPFTEYLLEIEYHLGFAVQRGKFRQGPREDSALEEIEMAVAYGIRCFTEYGIEPRDPHSVANARDGQDA